MIAFTIRLDEAPLKPLIVQIKSRLKNLGKVYHIMIAVVVIGK